MGKIVDQNEQSIGEQATNCIAVDSQPSPAPVLDEMAVDELYSNDNDCVVKGDGVRLHEGLDFRVLGEDDFSTNKMRFVMFHLMEATLGLLEEVGDISVFAWSGSIEINENGGLERLLNGLVNVWHFGRNLDNKFFDFFI